MSDTQPTSDSGSSVGRQRQKYLLAPSRDEPVEVAGRSTREIDKWGDATVRQSLGIPDFNNRARWHIEGDCGATEPHTPKVILPPEPLGRKLPADPVAGKKEIGRFVSQIAKGGSQRPLGCQG